MIFQRNRKGLSENAESKQPHISANVILSSFALKHRNSGGHGTFEVGRVVAHSQLPDMCVHWNGFMLVQGKQANTGSHLRADCTAKNRGVRLQSMRDGDLTIAQQRAAAPADAANVQ